MSIPCFHWETQCLYPELPLQSHQQQSGSAAIRTPPQHASDVGVIQHKQTLRRCAWVTTAGDNDDIRVLRNVPSRQRNVCFRFHYDAATVNVHPGSNAGEIISLYDAFIISVLPPTPWSFFFLLSNTRAWEEEQVHLVTMYLYRQSRRTQMEVVCHT